MYNTRGGQLTDYEDSAPLREDTVHLISSENGNFERKVTQFLVLGSFDSER